KTLKVCYLANPFANFLPPQRGGLQVEKNRHTGYHHPVGVVLRKIFIYSKSKRSAFITLVHAAIKSFTNFSLASLLAYTSAKALSSELEPKIRSARVAVHLVSPVALSFPSNIS